MKPATDPLGLLLAHAASRKSMTKAQLLADAEQCDDAYMDMWTEKEMAEAYWKDLDRHLVDVHRCDHDIYAEPEVGA